MKLNYWMTFKAVVVLVFGIGFVFIPVKLGAIFGLDFNPAGVLMAQLFGTAFIFEFVLLWLARNVSVSEKPMQAIITGVVVSNAIGFIVTLMATLADVWNALGWGPVILYLVFCVGFSFFLFKKKKAV